MFSTIQEAELFFNSRRDIGIKPGLERVQGLLDSVGNPEKDIKAIHVAGTNGKGSTICFLNGALRANGIQTGIFTSPSFTGLTGHIILNEQAIKESEFIKILNDIHPAIKKMDEKNIAPTEFEILTAIAFIFFAKKEGIVLIETGMGGRLDTTNVIQPLISIITNVAVDHTEYLGRTLEEIGYQKAGIIKPGTPVISGCSKDNLIKIIRDETAAKNSDIYLLGDDFYYEYCNETDQVQWHSKKKQLLISLSMKGEHQLKNVSLALKTLELLSELEVQINWKQALRGIANTTAPGRYEQMHTHPVIIVDAAHNPDGIRTLGETANADYPDKDKHVIVAMFRDKNIEEMLNLLDKYFSSVTLTSFEHPRAASVKELRDKAAIEVSEGIDEWKQLLSNVMKQEEKIIYITGSLFFITLVRTYISKEGQFL